VPEILASNVLTRSDIGLLATLFYITYGLSKFSPVSSATAPTPAILWAWGLSPPGW
jgi:sugar phosphate permease